MAITGTTYNAGTTGVQWVEQVWDNEIDRAPYQRGKLLKLVREAKPLMGQLNVSKHANLTPSTLANTADHSGHGITFAANTETKFTATPSSIQLNLSINDEMLEQMSTDPESTFKTSIEMAMAQKVDQDLATLFPLFSTNVQGSYAAPLDKSAFLALMSQVKNGAGEYADLGVTFAYHTLVEDSVFNIDAFVSAAFRGVTSASPAATGQLPTAYGVNFVGCGNVGTSGGGYANAMFVKRGIAISFNQKASVSTQRFGHALWLLCRMAYGYGTVRDGLCGLLKSA